jgi:hypothetical protein
VPPAGASIGPDRRGIERLRLGRPALVRDHPREVGPRDGRVEVLRAIPRFEPGESPAIERIGFRQASLLLQYHGQVVAKERDRSGVLAVDGQEAVERLSIQRLRRLELAQRSPDPRAVATARAMATRCRCPPVSAAGYRDPKSAGARPTRSRAARAGASASGRPSSHGSRAAFRKKVQRGRRPPSCCT